MLSVQLVERCVAAAGTAALEQELTSNGTSTCFKSTFPVEEIGNSKVCDVALLLHLSLAYRVSMLAVLASVSG